MTHKMMHAMGVRRGLAHSHRHLRHFYEASSHAVRTHAHMLGSGLVRMNFHRHHKHHHMIGHGAGHHRDSDSDEEGKGIRHHKHHRKPKPLSFKY